MGIDINLNHSLSRSISFFRNERAYYGSAMNFNALKRGNKGSFFSIFHNCGRLKIKNKVSFLEFIMKFRDDLTI